MRPAVVVRADPPGESTTSPLQPNQMPPSRCNASRSAIAKPPARETRSRGASSRFETITSRAKVTSPLPCRPSRAGRFRRAGEQSREPPPRLAGTLDPQATWRRLRWPDLDRDASARQHLVEPIFVRVVVAEIDRYPPREGRALHEARDGGALADRARLHLVDEPARNRLDTRIERCERALDPGFRGGRAVMGLAIMHRDGEALVLHFDALDAVEGAEPCANPLEVHRGAGQHRPIPHKPDLRALLTADRKPKRMKCL